MGRSPQTGVTLLELLVAMVILGIMLSLALPSFSTFLANTRLRGVADNIQSGLQVARMEALKRNEPTAFLLLGNNWMVNRAYNATTNPTVDQNSTSVANNQGTACSGSITAAQQGYQIQRSCGENSGVTIATNFSSTMIKPNTVIFDAQGRASADVSNPQIDLCAAGGSTQKYSILISTGGQLRMCDQSITTDTDMRHCDASFSASGC
jgi:type IV fimbrial biogenesis protein FimT